MLIKDDRLGSASNNVANVIPGGDIFRSQQNMNNEIGILKSFSLNYRVMKQLKDFHVVYIGVGKRGIVEKMLYKSCPFKVLYDSLELENTTPVGIEILQNNKYRIKINHSLNLDTIMNIGDRFNGHGFDFRIVPRDSIHNIFEKNSSNRYYFYFTNPGSLANEYRGQLSIVPIQKDASIVSLSVSGLVPEQEADYLNGLMQEYIHYGLEYKNGTADSTIKFINQQIKYISDSLMEVEERMENFRKTNKFFDISQEGAVIHNKLDKLDNEKTAFKLQLQYYDYLEEYFQNKNFNGTIISPSVMGITDQVLLRLVNELSDLKKERERLKFNLESNQPGFELIDNQAEEAMKALMENVRNGKASLLVSIKEVDRKLSGVDTLIDRLPTMEKKFINIQRKFDLDNTVYTYLLEKRAESGIAKASNLPDNRIIDYASAYGPIKPKTRNNIAIAIMLGLILPMVLIALIDFFNDKVIDKKDVERKTSVPVIGYISHSDSKKEMTVVERPGSSLSESFRSVRTALKYYIKENEVAVITISSTISSEGKTFISSNLAAIIAMVGKRVLLIGLDLRKPRINKIFEFEDSPGMSTYLSGQCNYEVIIKKTGIENLFYAPSGPVPPNPAELLETELLKEFLERAKKEFDYIIIDTPPVAIVTDALLLARYVDINLFIVRQRYSSRNTLDLIEQLNKNGELKKMAIIINDISLTGYYGYGMRYGYSRGYGYSYGSNYYSKGYYGRYGDSNKTKGYYVED